MNKSELKKYPVYMSSLQMGIIYARIISIENDELRKILTDIEVQLREYYDNWKKHDI